MKTSEIKITGLGGFCSSMWLDQRLLLPSLTGDVFGLKGIDAVGNDLFRPTPQIIVSRRKVIKTLQQLHPPSKNIGLEYNNEKKSAEKKAEVVFLSFISRFVTQLKTEIKVHLGSLPNKFTLFSLFYNIFYFMVGGILNINRIYNSLFLYLCTHFHSRI